MDGYLDYAVFKLIPWKSACELMHKTSWELGSRMCVVCVCGTKGTWCFGTR